MGNVVHLASSTSDAAASNVEPQTFEVFFTANRRALSSYLRRQMSNEADVQEVVQESYARILSYGYGCSRPPQVWRALLYRIATNLMYSRARMDKARNHVGHMSIDDVEVAATDPSQERVVMVHQELQIVRQVILGLSPKCRKVFLLSRNHHKTYPEIAEICGISVKMVEKYISKTLAALRRALGDKV